ncbi:MAG TPA: DUF5678 domain-containing protein [Anaerolineae bacterium]|jgi:Family of unknown function (DUF5678)
MKKVRETKTRYKTVTARISLDKELVERMRQAAEWKGIPFEEAANKALTEYLGRFGIEKVRAEQAIFERMRTALLEKYRGQYVAMHNGEIVESAPDLRSLHHKVFVRFGFTPILHIQVTDEPERDIHTHGLRMVRDTE